MVNRQGRILHRALSIDDFLGVAGQSSKLWLQPCLLGENNLSITFVRDFLTVFVEEADFIGLVLRLR